MYIMKIKFLNEDKEVTQMITDGKYKVTEIENTLKFLNANLNRSGELYEYVKNKNIILTLNLTGYYAGGTGLFSKDGTYCILTHGSGVFVSGHHFGKYEIIY